MLQWLTGELRQVQNLITLVVAVVATGVVGMVYFRTKALVATIGALVLAGAVTWGVSNVSWFTDKIKQDTSGAPAVVVTRPAGSSVGLPVPDGVATPPVRVS